MGIAQLLVYLSQLYIGTVKRDMSQVQTSGVK